MLENVRVGNQERTGCKTSRGSTQSESVNAEGIVSRGWWVVSLVTKVSRFTGEEEASGKEKSRRLGRVLEYMRYHSAPVPSTC